MAKDKDNDSRKLETVLVMQGGGSLGAYECGVYKALSKHGKKFDIVAGTSIGAINAAIITSSIADGDPSKKLEDFWLTLAQSIGSPIAFSLSDKNRAILSTTYSATWGNPNAFIPNWLLPENLKFPIFGLPYPLFDLTPLKETVSRFVEFDRLKRRNEGLIHDSSYTPRLIMTSTDIQRGEAVVFDNNRMDIERDQIIACVGFPFYGIGWTKIADRYLWDGSLLSNTPLVEVIDASPVLDKKVYIVNLFPHSQQEVPNDMLEAWHRARDIMYTDKTASNVRTSKIISKYLSLLKDMHDYITSSTINHPIHHEKLKTIEREYYKLAHQRGAVIQDIVRIERTEESRFLFEDADFSFETIKKLIAQGYDDAERALTKHR
jgi:NTE family protein